jgi:hypothetical protein
MALLTGPRNTPMKEGDSLNMPFGVEAGATIYLGSMVAVDDNGYVMPAQAKTGTAPLAKVPTVMGRADRVINGNTGGNAINVAGANMIPSPSNLGAAGSISIEVRRGVFLLDINGSSIGVANVGQLAFSVDDHTVDVSDGSGVTAVAAAAITTPAVGDNVQPLAHENIVAGTVVVQNSGQTVTYVEGTDYNVDYQGGLLTYLSAALTAGAVALKVSYSWESTTPTRPVCGQIVGLENGMVWIDVRRQSALAA